MKVHSVCITVHPTFAYYDKGKLNIRFLLFFCSPNVQTHLLSSVGERRSNLKGLVKGEIVARGLWGCMMKHGVTTLVWAFTQIDSRDYNLVLHLTQVSCSGRVNQINLALLSMAANPHLTYTTFTLKDIIEFLSLLASNLTRLFFCFFVCECNKDCLFSFTCTRGADRESVWILHLDCVV